MERIVENKIENSPLIPLVQHRDLTPNINVRFYRNLAHDGSGIIKPRTIVCKQPSRLIPHSEFVKIKKMAEDLSEQESPSLAAPEEVNSSSMIKVTIDDDADEETSVEPVNNNSNSVEKPSNPSQVMHDHNYGTCAVSLNSGDPYFGSNGEPFPLLEGLGDYVDNQNKISLSQKGSHPEHHVIPARTIRTSLGGSIPSMNFVDSKQREEILKRRPTGTILNRPREDVFVLSSRVFDNNRPIDQKKLQPTTLINKFPLRSAIKPGMPQSGIALSRQFGSPNSVIASNDQLNPNITYYQQRQTHRAQQPIILKATPRILQPVVPSSTYRRPQVQRQSIPQRKQATEEESTILDVVNEEEMRNQKFFQKQIGNQQNSMQQQASFNNSPQQPRQVTTALSNAPPAEDSTDPHGYFHRFQTVRHHPSNLMQSPTRQDFARQGYAAQPKPFYQSSQNQPQYGRLSQPVMQPSQFMSQDHHMFAGQQSNSFQSQSSIRPRVRKPLIETTESPQRTPKAFTTPITAPKSSGRGRKKKDSNEKVSAKKQQNTSYNENDQGDIEGVDYTTRCICGMKHNDPNMIACDSCDVWQHMVCLGIDPLAKNRNANAEYKCEKCSPRPLKYTREQAMEIQRKFLETVKEKAARGRKSTSKTPKSAKESNRARSNSDVHDKNSQRRLSTSATSVGKPESKFIETKITRGVRKILDKLSSGDGESYAKLSPEPLVQTLVVAPSVYGVVSKADIEAGNPIFEYKASLSLREERGAQNLTSKFFGNLIHVVPGKSDGDGEIIFADASRHSDVFSSKLRKSCQPNAEIHHFISKDRDNEELLRLFVVAREPIEECTEITIPLDLEYRNEIAEIDCACKTANYSSQSGRFADKCPVADYLQKKENGQQLQPKQEASPPKAVKKPSPPSPKQKPAERRRTTSNQAPAVTQSAVKPEEPKPEVSRSPVKTPTPLAEELEIASILTQDLPRSSSNTGTAKSLTSSPSRRSPVKTGSTKKSAEKSAKKASAKAKKEPSSETKKKPTTPRKSNGVSREMASLFDDNKFMSSSLEFDESARGRSLRQRAQVKKEEPETPTPSTSTKTPSSSGRKRQISQTATPATQPKPAKLKNNRDKVEIKVEESIVTPDQLKKALGRSMTFTLSSRLFDMAKKPKRSAA